MRVIPCDAVTVFVNPIHSTNIYQIPAKVLRTQNQYDSHYPQEVLFMRRKEHLAHKIPGIMYRVEVKILLHFKDSGG